MLVRRLCPTSWGRSALACGVYVTGAGSSQVRVTPVRQDMRTIQPAGCPAYLTWDGLQPTAADTSAPTGRSPLVWRHHFLKTQIKWSGPGSAIGTLTGQKNGWDRKNDIGEKLSGIAFCFYDVSACLPFRI